MNRTKEAGLNQLYTELKSTFKASLPEQSYEVESQVIIIDYQFKIFLMLKIVCNRLR